MQKLNEILKAIDGMLGGGDWFVFLLLGVGLFFTIYLKFPQLRFLAHAVRIVKGKYDKKEDVGDTSHFQALATALSGTVGTGNIGGVAFAIFLGGPAALFWMLVTAFLGMTTKFVEVTLSHKYRETAEDGSMAGGPMYFMKNKLNAKWLAAIFAVATVLSSFGTGNMPQVNNIASTVEATFGIQPLITGLVLAFLLFFVIVGGIKRIAAVTEKLVPTMAVIYFIGAFAVIFYNAGNILPSISAVVGDIFSGSAAVGGFLGGTFMFAFNRGVNRGLFSNEAGQGSAPIAHASAKAHEPVSEGMVAILEPLIDTIIICTITGLTLLSSGVWSEKHQTEFDFSELKVLNRIYDETSESDRAELGTYLLEDQDIDMYNGELTIQDGAITNDLSILHKRSIAEDVLVSLDGSPFNGPLSIVNGNFENTDIILTGKSLVHSAELTTIAFQKGFFGENGKFIVSIGLLLFAFSTAISWSYYGDRAMTYLFGSKSVLYYRIVYVAAFFFAAIADTSIIWTVANITIVLMTIPNLVGIFLLRKDMKETLAKYWVDFNKEWGSDK